MEVIWKLEQKLAIKTPVFEAEHAIDERSALCMYDCLVPKLKEHRRFKVLRDEQMTLADFKA